jgi:hypothetical protein
MDEILSVFNAYKKRVFNKIKTIVEEALEYSYNEEADNWSALDEDDKEEWNLKGGYGAWWYDWIDDSYQGIEEYVQQLWESHWSNDEVLNQTLEAKVGLDPMTVYNELRDLVYGVALKTAGLSPQNTIDKEILLDFINWPVDNPKELI